MWPKINTLEILAPSYKALPRRLRNLR